MYLRNAFIYLLVLVVAIPVQAQKGVGLPVVYSLNPVQLLSTKEKIAQGSIDVLPAYRQLISEADKALAFGPVSVMQKKHLPPSGNKHDYMSLAPYFWPDPAKKDGLPYIRKDGETNPEVKEYSDKENQPALCDKVFKLSLAYFFSGEKKYAEHASNLLRVWFLDSATRMNPNLNFGQAIKGITPGRGAGLIDIRHYIKVVDAIGLLKSSGYWTASDDTKMKTWVSDFLNWMQTNKIGRDEMNAKNNHGMWYDAVRLSLSLYTNNTQLAKQIVINAKNRLDKQMDDNGRFPKEMERTISLHYSVFVVDAFINIAQMAEKLGYDLYTYTTPGKKSLKMAIDQLLPYLLKQKQWDGKQIKEFDFKEVETILETAYLKYNCNTCKQALSSISDKNSLLTLLY